MSGGSYDYVFWKIEELAHSIRRQQEDPRRASFAKLMALVGKAMHDIEWVDSGDCGPGDEHAAIDTVFAFLRADPETIRKAHAFDELKKRMQEYFKEAPDPAKENS